MRFGFGGSVGSADWNELRMFVLREMNTVKFQVQLENRNEARKDVQWRTSDGSCS